VQNGRPQKERKEKTVMKRFLACLFALLCLAALPLPEVALAASPDASLTLSCAVGGTAVPGVRCRLYRVASLSGTAFTATDSFRQAQVQLNGLTTAAQWQAAADSLSVFATAEENGISPDCEGQTDAAGSAAFSGLATGLYLAVFTDTVQGDTTYRFSAALLSLPQWNADGSVVYQVTAAPKGTAVTPPSPGSQPSTVSVTVLKIWNDRGKTASRPASIRVALLCNGKTYATAVLSASNNWRCTWDGLSASDTWRVLERGVPSGYTVSYRTRGTTLILANTRTTGTTISDEPVPLGSAKLPQTGLLWWPVPLLSAGGLLLFGAGWYDKNKKHEEK
jgi:hypothetical protein